MNRYSKWHSVLALVMLLPLVIWITTGAVFLVKPGYEKAYAKIAPRSYPIDQRLDISPQDDWQELRVVRTVIGIHLMVKIGDHWQQLDIETLKPAAEPDELSLVALVQDAITVDPNRYGRVDAYEDGVFTTDTGVELKLDWNSLSLTQRGRDTRIISALYKAHYLEWFGQGLASKLFGLMGLLALVALVAFGVFNYLRARE